MSTFTKWIKRRKDIMLDLDEGFNYWYTYGGAVSGGSGYTRFLACWKKCIKLS
jgi:hypothetical protein